MRLGERAGAEQADVTEAATLAFGTPPGIVLSPQDPTVLGRPTADLPITAAYAVASLDPVLRTGPARPDLHGTVEGLAVAIAWSPRTRSCAGIAASSADDGPTPTGPDDQGSTTPSPPW